MTHRLRSSSFLFIFFFVSAAYGARLELGTRMEGLRVRANTPAGETKLTGRMSPTGRISSFWSAKALELGVGFDLSSSSLDLDNTSHALGAVAVELGVYPFGDKKFRLAIRQEYGQHVGVDWVGSGLHSSESFSIPVFSLLGRFEVANVNDFRLGSDMGVGASIGSNSGLDSGWIWAGRLWIRAPIMESVSLELGPSFSSHSFGVRGTRQTWATVGATALVIAELP